MQLLSIIEGNDTTGLYEIRCRNPRNGRIGAREWFGLNEQRACERFIREHAPKLDVYVGAALRTGREGGKSAIARVWCLWADCDTIESIQRLHSFEPAPALIIGSGNGQHAWWPLSYPLSPAWAERANRRVAHALGADMKATDAARILRPPGTFNHKFDPPKRVTTEMCVPGWAHEQVREPFLLPVAAIVGRLDDPPGRIKPRQARADISGADLPLLNVSADRYYQTLTGRPVTRGNVTCPFHSGGKERSPSMRLYDTTWYCWGCAKGGSVFEFGAMLWGLDTRGFAFIELKQRLSEALHVV